MIVRVSIATNKHMRITGFRLVLAAVFMLAQFISVSHASAYNDIDHTHDGKPCIVSATCGKLQQLTLTDEITLLLHTTEHVHESTSPLGTIPDDTITTAPIRAPPLS